MIPPSTPSSPAPTLPPDPLRPPASDHYLDLEDANLVPTSATRRTQELLRITIKASGLMCIHGDVGLGKTLAVNTNLRDLCPNHTRRVVIPANATMYNLRTALYRAVGLPGEPPNAAICERLIKDAFRENFHILVCDEAQRLSVKALEYLRDLWDDEQTRMALIFVGGENCHHKIRSRPALRSRMTAWQQYSPLTADEVLTVIPRFHPLWYDAPTNLIQWTNDLACHGNFRNWAKLTGHLQFARHDNPGVPLSKELIRWAFSNMDGTGRGGPDPVG